jgi:hypothetical protein
LRIEGVSDPANPGAALYENGALLPGPNAVLAAQNAYATSGDFPELLTVYHLFGDPALNIR